MTYDVLIPPRVRVELRVAASWHLRTSYSPAVAERWHQGFLAALAALGANPSRFGLARESDLFPFEVRELLYGSGRRKTHRALSRIVENRVEVLSIRQMAQHDLTPDDL